MTRTLQQVIGSIESFDDLEEAHREDALAWIALGSPIYRIAKPATPPKHLVAYCALVDPLHRSVLLVDHRDAGLWLTTGGHVDPGEDSAAAAQRELSEELALSPTFVRGLEAAPFFITCTLTEGVSAGHRRGRWMRFVTARTLVSIVDSNDVDDELLVAHANTLVVIATPWWLCSWRAVRRGLRRPPETQLPEGCDESFSQRIGDEWGIAWRNWRNRKTVPENDRRLAKRCADHMDVHLLSDKQELADFVRRFSE